MDKNNESTTENTEVVDGVENTDNGEKTTDAANDVVIDDKKDADTDVVVDDKKEDNTNSTKEENDDENFMLNIAANMIKAASEKDYISFKNGAIEIIKMKTAEHEGVKAYKDDIAYYTDIKDKMS